MRDEESGRSVIESLFSCASLSDPKSVDNDLERDGREEESRLTRFRDCLLLTSSFGFTSRSSDHCGCLLG